MLSTTSEHALRAVIRLARLPEGASMLGRDLADEARIPPNYLSKILWTLGNAGLIDATRGAGGGYRLKRSPGEIRLCEVIDLFERDRVKHACLLGNGQHCDPDNPCSAHAAWRGVRSAYLDFMERTTVAEIARGQNNEG